MRRTIIGIMGLAPLVLAACTASTLASRSPAEPLTSGGSLPAVAVSPVTTSTHSPPASIDPTGTRDVTAELQAFLDRVPHHAAIVFPAGAKYRIEGTLTVRSRNDLLIDGNGATFFATQPTDIRTRYQWDLRNVSNVIIEEMTIRGAHPAGGVSEAAYVAALEAQHGVNIAGGERIEVRGMTITDVYGDFVYVGRSPSPVFGTPTHIRIHDNTFRRNGRQGVSVTDGYDVVIERNDIAQTRRATFDLEPGTASGSVREVRIRDNAVGPGRLMFVAGHGRGDVSDIYIEGNRLHGRGMGMDFAAPADARRSNVVIRANTSDVAVGTGRGTVVRFVNYDHVRALDNVQPTQARREMHMVGSYNSCAVTATGNDLGANGAGQAKILADTYDCSGLGPLTRPAPAEVFSGERMEIDMGGPGTTGVLGCPDASACHGFLIRGSVVPAAVQSVSPPSPRNDLYRTMLEGDARLRIPIRGGTYDVDLWFVEPVAGDRERRFHVDIERERRLSGFDVYHEAGGTGIVVHRRERVTVGDGALDIDLAGGAGAIVSAVSVSRV